MSDLASSLVSSSPRQQFRARLRQQQQRSSTEQATTEENNNQTTFGGQNDRWKRKYDLAMKHSLAKHLAAPQQDNRTLHNDTAADEILSPSSEEDMPHAIGSASSADDSIIRRVEEEIAAARKAASGVTSNRRGNNNNKSGDDGVDDDMMATHILQDNEQEEENHHQQHRARRSAAHNISHTPSDVALELIQDEFLSSSHHQQQQYHQHNHHDTQSYVENDGVDTVPAPPADQTKRLNTSEHLYFTDEEWQTKDIDHTAMTDENMPTTEESEPPSSPEMSSRPDMMMESTTDGGNIDGKSTYVFRLVRSPLRPSDTSPMKETSTVQQQQQRSAEHDSPTAEKRQEEDTVPLDESPISTPVPDHEESPIDEQAQDQPQQRNKEPEGNYSSDTMPPTTSAISRQQSSHSSEQEIHDIQSLATAASKKDMDRLRTRELLGSLKEQRSEMTAPSASTFTRRHVEQSPRRTSESPTTPRSPNHFTFSRANRARERVKTASKSSVRTPRSDGLRTPRRGGSSPRSTPRSTPRSHRKPNFPDHENLLPSKRGKPEEDPRLTRRIRFRNPFPVLKPPINSRSAELIVQDHETGVPEAPIRWVKPKRELKQLIVAAMGTSLPRRSNACGALKVLTRQKKNQLALVRTDGFLSALIFAASQSLVETDRELAQVARTRAVNCLKHVSEPKDNRVLIMNHPGVLECLVKVIKSDGGEGRALATASLAMLAKTACCREGLARGEGLVDCVAKIMNGATPFISEEVEPLIEEPSRAFTDSVSEFSQSEGTSQNRRSKSEDQDEEVTAVSESSASDREDDEDDEEQEGDENGDPEEPSVAVTIPKHELGDPMTDSIRFKAEERQQEFTDLARANACAVLLHLSKQCAISPQLCTESEVLRCILSVAREAANPIHTKCLEIISNMTRFPPNNHILTRFDGMIDTLVAASNSHSTENRICALRSLQNMAANPSSKALLATSKVLNLMTACAMRKEVSEKEVAVATIYNITTEPSAVTAITNTKNVVATLVHLAHSPDSSSSIRLLACEALATISLWLQTLAGSGKVPEGITNVPLPSQKTTGWERWD